MKATCSIGALLIAFRTLAYGQAGTIDPSFAPGTISIQDVHVAEMQGDGKVLVGGAFSSIAGVTRDGFARLFSDGSLDLNYSKGSSINDTRSISVLPDGRVASANNFFARHSSSGSNTLTMTVTGAIHAMTVQPDGKTVVVGKFTEISGFSEGSLARITVSGVTEGFSASANDHVYSVVLEPDGKYLIGGAFTTANGTSRKGLARLNSSGTLEGTTFGAGADEPVRALLLQPDGKILVAGDFTEIDGQPRNRIARLNADGTVESLTTFNPGLGMDDEVRQLALQTDGKILVAGIFGTVNGQTRNGIARLNADGSLDNTVNFASVASFTGNVRGLTQQADGKILLFGSIPGGVVRLRNGTATQSMTISSNGQVQWIRGGTSPEVEYVTFELSTNAGQSWTPLGTGTRVVGGWRLTGLSLPSTGLVRGVGRGGGSLYEIVQAIDFSTQAPTLTLPVVNGVYRNSVPVAYNLPEAGLAGTGKLIFHDGVTPRVLTLATAELTAGAHAFSFNPTDPTATALIVNGAAIPNGRYSVSLEYQDELGNPAVTSASVANVVVDSMAPELSLPQPITAEAQGPGGATVSFSVTATDQLDPAPALVVVPASGSVFPIGETIVEVTTTDWAGNSETESFTVTVKDSIAPAIVGQFAPLTIAAGANGTAPFPDYSLQASVTDAVGVTSVTQSPPSGGTHPPGTTLVTITATDAAGNMANVSFNVTVVDVTVPTVIAPPNGFVPLTLTTGVEGTASLPDYRDQAVIGDNVGVQSVTQAPAPASARLAGITIVRITVKDAAGNESSIDFEVSVADGTAPVITAPVGGFSPLVITADDDGTAILPDYLSQATISDNVGVTFTEQSPVIGSTRLFGETLVTLTAKDAAGNMQQTSFVVSVGLDGPLVSTMAATGEAVPGAGVDARIPSDAKFTTFGLPVVSDRREVCFLGKWKAGRVVGSGIFVGNPAALLVAVGEEAPGISGATFKTLQEPLMAPDGTVAFGATVKGVKAAQDQGVWMTVGGVGGVPTLVLREGFPIAGAPTGYGLKSVTGVSLRDGELLVMAKLAPARGVITAANDTVLLRVTATGATVLLQKGDLLDLQDGFPASKVTALTALVPATGSPGHGRWQADGAATVQVKLASGRSVALSLAADGSVTRSVGIGQGVTNLADSAVFSLLNLPAMGANGNGAVLRGNLTGITIPGLPPVVTPKDDTILAFSAGPGSGYAMFAREGSTAVGAGQAVYAKFLDPIVNDAGAVAFVGTLSGKGVTPQNNSGLWWGEADDLELLARTNEFAPGPDGVATTARWGSFVSTALPSGPEAGPMFLARVRGSGVTAKNNTGLWGVDSTGKLRQLLRTGDLVNGSAVVGINALAGTVGSLGATRGFNERGTVVARVTMAKGAQAVVRIDVPEGKGRITEEEVE